MMKKVLSLTGHVGLALGLTSFTLWHVAHTPVQEGLPAVLLGYGVGAVGFWVHLVYHLKGEGPGLLPERIDVSPSTRHWIRRLYGALGLFIGTAGFLYWTPFLP